LTLPHAVAQTNPPKKFSVEVSATVQESPSQIALSWPGDSDATSYDIYRRTMESGWQPLTTIGGGQNSWTDTGVSAGVRYEYKFIKHTGPGYIGYGYLASGIHLAAVDYWGKLVLLVESSLAGPLSAELNQLQSDLTGEGWTVVRRDVSMNDSPQSVKDTIKSIYYSDTGNVHAVFLFGHIPVPYSGDIFPDGHPNHQGAWPADVYYADMDGTWTDSTVNDASAERQTNWNVPGDGKFDQSTLPSPAELMVGRVDLNNMTCYSNKANSRSEVDLMRQYLNKDHAFRFAQLPVQKRGLICDNFSDKGTDPISGSAWRNWAGFFDINNVDEVGWDSYLPAASSGSYLWSYGSGGGSYYYSTGVATSDDFALQDIKVVFTMWMGSYFGDWNNESNFLRAPLGSGWVLTSTYSGAPHTMNFPMSMGMPIGYCMLISQNNATNTLYEPWVQGTSQVHLALLGDPTLRLSPVQPVAGLSASGSGKARLSWNASPDSNIQGYYIYRASSSDGPYSRIKSDFVTGTSFSDPVSSGTYVYMVRAIKLEQSGGGTYLNPSQGAFTTVTVSAGLPQIPFAPVLTASVVSSSRVDLSWTDVANETSYALERRAGSGSNWTSLGSLSANTTSFSDLNLPANTSYTYRIRASNSAGDSPNSAEVTVTTQPGIISDNPVRLALRGGKGGLVLTVTGDYGQQFKVQSSLDLQNWQYLSNGTVTGSSVDIPISVGGQNWLFLRAMNMH
jgi:fibronectin type 3 domain-containing protein